MQTLATWTEKVFTALLIAFAFIVILPIFCIVKMITDKNEYKD